MVAQLPTIVHIHDWIFSYHGIKKQEKAQIGFMDAQAFYVAANQNWKSSFIGHTPGWL